MKSMRKTFLTRTDLIAYVKSIAPWAHGDASQISASRDVLHERLGSINPKKYSNTRNYGNGFVTGLSPYIRHGMISLEDVLEVVNRKASVKSESYKLRQELAWRAFWQRLYYQKPEWIWEDIENYKTGLSASKYSEKLPQDILDASTPNASINYFINQLYETGYLHNHARMYLASYVVHWRRVKWQVGAQWFLEHLLDGDPASNNFSWQWVASTFSNRPYIFNLENVSKYFESSGINVKPQDNPELNFSYEELTRKLFPEKYNE